MKVLVTGAAGFIGSITDLSVKDPYFVLPVLTGASMWLLQKLQPTTVTDPMQQKIDHAVHACGHECVLPVVPGRSGTLLVSQ